MALNMGIAAGALADIFLEDNERVTKSTDETLNTLAQLVISEDQKRKKKLVNVEEQMSRLEALGFKRPVAASIARGGLYAVNDAVTAAGKARDFGEDVNSYYVTQAKYNSDEFADYTRAEMAEAIVPVSNIKGSADILTKGKRINTDRVNEAVGKYVGATPEASSIDVPVFAQDVSKMGGGKLDFTAQRNAALNFRRIITDRANIQGKEKSGLTLGFDASGNRTFMINNPQQYSTWIKSQIPDIIKLQEKRLPPREMEAFNAHIELITSDLEDVKTDDDPFSLGKAKSKSKGLTVEITPEDQKINVIADQLRKGSTPETIKNQIQSLYPELKEDRINTLIEEGQKQINMEKFPDYGAPNVG